MIYQMNKFIQYIIELSQIDVRQFANEHFTGILFVIFVFCLLFSLYTSYKRAPKYNEETKTFYND
jgi:hypothetical protein